VQVMLAFIISLLPFIEAGLFVACVPHGEALGYLFAVHAELWIIKKLKVIGQIRIVL